MTDELKSKLVKIGINVISNGLRYIGDNVAESIINTLQVSISMHLMYRNC